ncbi:c-type cytochrome [Gemmata sp. G18]|uniref:C-type cytochrome n=1 Tax=Gemmata palustris TaxID=2822762 RepID=A0ABS5C027_9BACT|nr:c-type cytochrome [Gemmata palustris]MBP3959299.1 c-type cytochrome [Gemmata palustris]
MFSRCGVVYALFVGSCALIGCGPSAPVESGPKGVYEQNCAKCHAQAGEPGGPPSIGASKGPKLSKIGAEPNRSADWLADYIRDPKSKKADSRMPAFGGTLTEEQIRSLAEYLAAKK